jgi:hypothetical protein
MLAVVAELALAHFQVRRSLEAMRSDEGGEEENRCADVPFETATKLCKDSSSEVPAGSGR